MKTDRRPSFDWRKWRTAIVVLLVAIAAPALAGAQPSPTPAPKPWSVALSYDYASRYLYRGLDVLGGEPVQVGHVVATVHGLSGHWWGFWGDLPTADGASRRYVENDFALEGTLAGQSAWATAGALAYTYEDPAVGTDTTEVYAIAGLANSWSPKLSIFYDVDSFDGGYASLGVARRFALAGGLALTPSASLGHSLGWTHRVGDPQRRHAVWDVNDALVGVDLGWSKGGLVVHAAAQQSFALSAVEDVGGEDLTVFTAGASYSF